MRKVRKSVKSKPIYRRVQLPENHSTRRFFLCSISDRRNIWWFGSGQKIRHDAVVKDGQGSVYQAAQSISQVRSLFR